MNQHAHRLTETATMTART